MLRVSNKSCIRELSKKSFRASKTRNIIAVLAIALTTVLFTSLFTVALSVNEAIQDSNFRMAGGYAHGSFKYLTEEQYLELRDDPLIQEYGVRRVVGMAAGDDFRKNHVEVGWSDENNAHWMWLDPVEGRLPREGTDEAATDVEVLRLLGVEPRIGAKFTMPIHVDGKEDTEQTFTLCGWWENDPAVVANHVLIPESRVNAILDEMGVVLPYESDIIGSWNLDVMYSNARNIAKNTLDILARHGYQNEMIDGKTYIAIGVNWAYTGAQLMEKMDPMTAISIAALLLLIVFTGYLIIYNVFQISVVSDIRFYGLLKTIGTTGKQIKALLRRQALILCIFGIPLGCVMGWLLGAKLTPIILSQLNGVSQGTISASPWIFVGSALFAVLTVLISCARPGRMAAKVSPVEAVRYTEGGSSRKKARKGGAQFSVRHMAWANLGRSRGKTLVTILSLTLAVVLLQMTVLFTNGFDMDKYLAAFSVSDFIVSNAEYFQSNGQKSWIDGPEALEAIRTQGGVTEGGCVYRQPAGMVQEFITEDYYRHFHGRWMSQERIDALIAYEQRTDTGLICEQAQTSGMDPYALDQLKVYEGDISELYESGSRSIAAVYSEDDYGNLIPDSHWAKLGDTVTLRYVSEWELYDLETGEVYENEAATRGRAYHVRPLVYEDVEFTVAAVVSVPSALSYRYYGADEFVMNADTFRDVTGSNDILLYAFDTTEEANPAMEAFLKHYTNEVDPGSDYESRATYQAEFEGFRSMFLLIGALLSFIVGLVGVLNFVNAILTGILTRRREFAMLQSIGMTGRQLKSMLMYEGLLYALGSVTLALVLSLAAGPLAASVLEKLFWFFTYRPTFVPILIVAPVFALVGCVVPLLVYRSVSKQTIVERLREAEG